jgi:subtilisin family serine protease
MARRVTNKVLRRIKARNIVLTGIPVLTVSLFMTGLSVEGATRYVPAEIIIKFKPGEIPLNFKERIHKEENLTLKGTAIKEVRDLPDKIKALANDKTTVEPVFKALHRKMRGQRKMPAKKLDNLDMVNVYVLKNIDTKDRSVEEACQELSENPNIEYAQPNYIYEIQMFPDDPYYSSSGTWGQSYDDLWGLKKIQCEGAWDIAQGYGITVAVIDTGIDYEHEDIVDNIWTNPGEIPDNGVDDDSNGYIDDVRGWDFVDTDVYDPKQDNVPMDGHGHGTHVAGIIAAVGNNHKGIIGVAPEAKVVAVKGLDDNGSGDDHALAECLTYAADNGARVINISWGGYDISSVIEDAVSYAHSMGCVLIAGAGNNNNDASYFFPANIPDVITIAASDTTGDQKASFSDWGPKIDATAPGAGILSLRAANTDMHRNSSHIVGTNYYRGGGTSASTAFVSGLAALILSRDPGLGNEPVRNAILNSAYSTREWSAKTGYGTINAYKALNDMNTSPLPQVKLYYPYDLPQSRSFDLFGSASVINFSSFRMEYTLGSNTSWETDGVTLQDYGLQPVVDGKLGNITIPENYFGTSLTLPITIQLSVTGSNGSNYVSSLSFDIDRRIKSGWPKIISHINSYDLNGTLKYKTYAKFFPEQNRILAKGDYLYLLNTEGQEIGKITLPADLSRQIETAICDFDPDVAGTEIVAGTVEPGGNLSTNVFYENNLKEPWYRNTGQPLGLLLADINEDSFLETIVAPTAGYNGKTSIKVIDRFGRLTESADIGKEYSFSSVVAGDINQDGQIEIIAVYQPLSGDKFGLIICDNHLNMLKQMESTEDIYNLRLASLNNDENIKILTRYFNPDTNNGGVVAYNGDLTLYLKLDAGQIPLLNESRTNLLIADLDRDAKPEIIAYNKIWRNDGSLWKTVNIIPLVAADLDGDRNLELLGYLPPDEELAVYDIDNDNDNVMVLSRIFGSYPAIGDFDNDGLNEILSIDRYSGSAVYLSDTAGIYNSEGTWPQQNYDSLNSSFYKNVSATISGYVTLQNAVNHNTQITFELRNPGTTAIIANTSNDEDPLKAGTQVTTGPNGMYTLNNVPQGTYDITARGKKWLRQKKPHISIRAAAGSTTPLDFNLLGGDANNSNNINIFDLNILKASYSKSAVQPGYDENADFDNSGSVNVLDLNILKTNYGKSGDE